MGVNSQCCRNQATTGSKSGDDGSDRDFKLTRDNAVAEREANVQVLQGGCCCNKLASHSVPEYIRHKITLEKNKAGQTTAKTGCNANAG